LYAKWRDMKHDAKTDDERGKFDGKAALLDVTLRTRRAYPSGCHMQSNSYRRRTPTIKCNYNRSDDPERRLSVGSRSRRTE
jgi:hypothetical protein